MAIVGGISLTVAIVLTCVSIVGRTVGLGAVRGDVELTEALVAFAIFAFLPLCHITAGHAAVDVFTNWITGRPFRLLQFAIEVLFAVVLVVIAVQLWEGLQGMIRSGRTTFLLEFPIWWSYAASMTGASVAALVGVWTALARGWEVLVNDDLVEAEGTGH